MSGGTGKQEDKDITCSITAKKAEQVNDGTGKQEDKDVTCPIISKKELTDGKTIQ